jgi:hypothetical protein
MAAATRSYGADHFALRVPASVNENGVGEGLSGVFEFGASVTMIFTHRTVAPLHATGVLGAPGL